MRDAKDFLGRGWGFPVSVSADGDVSLSEYEEDVAEAIRIILGTNRGERIMRPDFGADLQRFVFESMSRNILALIRHRVEEALVRWEPRIDLKQVTVTPNRSVPGEVTIEIRYLVRSTNTFFNLVYPFYLQEGTEEVTSQ